MARPKNKPEDTRVPLFVRLRPEMEAFIKDAAARHGSSKAAEVYKSIYQRMEREGLRPQGVVSKRYPNEHFAQLRNT